MTNRYKIARAKVYWLGGVLALLISACAPLPEHSQHMATPQVHAMLGDNHSFNESAKAEPPRWVQAFDAANLDALISEALNNNYDLRASAARWRGVEQLAKVRAGKRWPTVDLGIDSRRDGITSSVTETSVISESSSAVLSTQWELDVWGGVAAGADSALNQALQQKALLRWSQFSLAAQVGKTWLDAIAAKQQWQLSLQREKNLQANVGIIEAGFKHGFRAAVDVYSARAELANNQSNSVARKQRYHTIIRQLAVLLGRYPNAPIELPSELPPLTNGLPASLSLQLIERRPDVKAAAYAISAQQAAVKTAAANRLPNLNIRASYGAANDTLGKALKGDDIVWNIGAGLTAPLFRGGQLAAEQRRQQALLQASLADYKQVALTALQEVEQNLTDGTLLHDRIIIVGGAKQLAEKAQQQAFEAYTSGLSNLNTWLQAQRNSYDRTSELIQLRVSQLKNRIDLYLALGGYFVLESK